MLLLLLLLLVVVVFDACACVDVDVVRVVQLPYVCLGHLQTSYWNK